MISYKSSFIVLLWIPPCCLLLFKEYCLQDLCNWWCCHLILFNVVESSNNELFQVSFVFLISPCTIRTFFVMLCSPFLWLCCNSFHFGCAKQVLRSMVNSTVLFLFIYNFWKFKWWCCGHHAIPNIATSFINNLF